MEGRAVSVEAVLVTGYGDGYGYGYGYGLEWAA